MPDEYDLYIVSKSQDGRIVAHRKAHCEDDLIDYKLTGVGKDWKFLAVNPEDNEDV